MIKFPAQAKILKDIRHENELTLKSFAAKVGINPTRAHRLECGRADITLKEAILLSTKFGMRIFDENFLREHLSDCYKAPGRTRGTIRGAKP